MIASRIYYLPIGLIREGGHESVCPLCWRQTVVFAEPGGPLEVFEATAIDHGESGDLLFGLDLRGNVDGWLALRIHVCSGSTKKEDDR